MNKKRLVFILSLLLVASITGVTFATTTATGAITVDTAGVSGDFAAVTAISSGTATTKYAHSTGSGPNYTKVVPSWTPITNAASDITAGDLYHINADNYSGDILVTLYITNPEELKKNYSYMLMNIDVYAGSTANFTNVSWTEGTGVLANGDNVGTVYLSLSGGLVSFIPDGDEQYTITMDGGSVFAIDTDAAGGALSPAFFLDIGQA